MKPDLVIIVRAVSTPWLRQTRQWIEALGPTVGQITMVGETAMPAEFPTNWRWIETAAQGPLQKRRLGFMASSSPLVIFSDDDTWMEPPTLSLILSRVRTHAGPLLLRGSYQSPPGLPRSGRAYNILCDNWVRADSARFLGGAFALWNAPRTDSLWEGINQLSGEEEVFATRWLRAGMSASSRIEYPMWHDSRATRVWFFARACRQGLTKDWALSVASPTSLRPLFVGTSWPVKGWLLIHFAGILAGAVLHFLAKAVRKKPRTDASA